MDVMEKVTASPEDWQPGIEGMVDDIKLEVRKINKHMEQIVIDQSPSRLEASSRLHGRHPCAHLPE
jgi:hypothetical protein